MNYTEEHLDKIDDELSRPERNGDPPKFSQSISTDPELKAAAEDVELVWQATRLERLQGKLEMLKGYEEEAKAEAKEDKKIPVISIRRMRWVLSAAAGVLLLVAVGWFLLRDQGPQEIKHEYLAMHFEEFLLHDVKRSATGVQEFTREQLKAYSYFETQQFNLALPLLEDLWSKEQDSLALFYAGLSYLAKGKEVQADAHLQVLLENNKYREYISILNK